MNNIQNRKEKRSVQRSSGVLDLKTLKTSIDGKANSSHTHNYAGSSSAGGAATSALTCTGNSATATKATQDSAGQQINTTYIKELSVSGRTITYTKGNGTTETITIQDTNTTYSTGTATTSGLTKLYTGTGTATDGTMTQAAINTALSGKADSSHGNHVPSTQTANARVFLRNDNTWQTLPSASTSATGIVQLNDAVDSTSTTQAATANAVKKAYDRANQAFQSGNDVKNKLVDTLIAKGFNASTSDSFDILISYVNLLEVKPAEQDKYILLNPSTYDLLNMGDLTVFFSTNVSNFKSMKLIINGGVNTIESNNFNNSQATFDISSLSEGVYNFIIRGEI